MGTGKTLTEMDFWRVLKLRDTTPNDVHFMRYNDEIKRRIKNARRWDLIESRLTALLDKAHEIHAAGTTEMEIFTGELFNIEELASIPDGDD